MNADQPKQEAKATACPKCGGGMLECGIETSMQCNWLAAWRCRWCRWAKVSSTGGGLVSVR